MIRNYRILNKIGSGSYSTVYKAENISNNQIYALKDIFLHNLSDKEKEQLVMEVCIQKCNTNPFIIKYIDSFIIDEHVYIVSEYAENGDLQSLINNYKKNNKYFNNSFISKTIIQISIGLSYLHKYHIVHRDLKPSNIFYDNNWDVKIGDLGIAKFFPDNNLMHSCIGSPLYMSPETFSDNGYNELTDIWSLGCILYNILTLNPPFNATNLLKLAYIINNENVKSIPNNILYYNEWQNIINSLLNKKIDNRPSAINIAQNKFLIKLSGININYINNIINKSNLIQENIKNIYSDISSSSIDNKLSKINEFHLKYSITLPPLKFNKFKRYSDSALYKLSSLTHPYNDLSYNILPPLSHR
jgi:NIMA (never in mitosis gene a)-related kinase